jgi:CRISPR-associated endonuclease Cas1
MKKHLNTLFVTTQGAYLAKEGETVVVRVESTTRLQLPIHTIGGIVCFGQISCSPYLMGFCAERGVALTFLTEHGRFLARVQGAVSGNVLLRREQYRWADDLARSADVARAVIIGKIANCRTVLQRALRDHGERINERAIRRTIVLLGRCLERCGGETDLDVLRGIEGESAHAYFSVFDHLIVWPRRTRSPFRSVTRGRHWTESIACFRSCIHCSLTTHGPRWSLSALILPSDFSTGTGPDGPAWLSISWKSFALSLQTGLCCPSLT